MLARAERMHRHMFGLQHEETARPCWEPPVDVLETERDVIVFTALPGVDPEGVTLAIEEGVLLIAGQRTLPPELRTAVIHRLELPQGSFRRAVRLPPGRYDKVARTAANGCLIVTLRKQARG
ncbi:MAG TPA: Hsp20/alpha crystallin family protein [Aliidongia sp.]|nr:Hsp20/alpha crystallin family protein [Aliidongia sp.]